MTSLMKRVRGVTSKNSKRFSTREMTHGNGNIKKIWLSRDKSFLINTASNSFKGMQGLKLSKANFFSKSSNTNFKLKNSNDKLKLKTSITKFKLPAITANLLFKRRPSVILLHHGLMLDSKKVSLLKVNLRCNNQLAPLHCNLLKANNQGKLILFNQEWLLQLDNKCCNLNQFMLHRLSQ